MFKYLINKKFIALVFLSIFSSGYVFAQVYGCKNGCLGYGGVGSGFTNGKNAVTALQEMLVKAGYDVKGVDGFFGANTRAALVQFQKDNKLKAVDGILGDETLNALKNKLSPESRNEVANNVYKSNDVDKIYDKSGVLEKVAPPSVPQATPQVPDVPNTSTPPPPPGLPGASSDAEPPATQPDLNGGIPNEIANLSPEGFERTLEQFRQDVERDYPSYTPEDREQIINQGVEEYLDYIKNCKTESCIMQKDRLGDFLQRSETTPPNEPPQQGSPANREPEPGEEGFSQNEFNNMTPEPTYPKTFEGYVAQISDSIKDGFESAKNFAAQQFDKITGNAGADLNKTLQNESFKEGENYGYGNPDQKTPDSVSTLPRESPLEYLNDLSKNLDDVNKAMADNIAAREKLMEQCLSSGCEETLKKLEDNFDKLSKDAEKIKTELTKALADSKKALEGQNNELDKIKNSLDPQPSTDKVTRKFMCKALADNVNAPIDPASKDKYHLVNYTPKGAGTGSWFELNSAPVKSEVGKAFVSKKGEIVPTKKQVCCGQVGKINGKEICLTSMGIGTEVGALTGSNGGNTAK